MNKISERIMARATTIFLCFILFATGFSQTSIGFRQPADTTPITSYRLPSWGYKTLKLSLSSHGGGGKTDGAENAPHGLSTNGSGEYLYFRESDHARVNFLGALSAAHNLKKGRGFTFSYKDFENGRIIDTDLSLDLEMDRYLNNIHHLAFHVDFGAGYDDAKEFLAPDLENRTEWEGGRSEYRNNILGGFTLGYGLGRIRNVTPVLRALRFRERYAALGRAQKLSAVQVQDVAHIFAQYSGYRAVYDREKKYFWNEVYSAINVEELTPFQLYYLGEAMAENIGQRYEGWQVDLQYQLRTAHQKGSLDGYWKYLYQKVGVLGRWYKNLHLNHQLELNIYPGYSSSIFLNSDWSKLSISARIGHLWVLADRLTLNSIIGFLDENEEYIQNTDNGQLNDDKKQNRAYVSSGLSYYVQDRLVLTTNASWQQRGNYTDWSLSFFLTYFLDRSLR